VRCRLTEDGARVRGFFVACELPSGATLRDATEADLATLNAIERETGIEHGDGGRVTTSRGARFFDWVRLQGDVRVAIVEVDGAPAACDAIAYRVAAYQSREVCLVYRHHTRVRVPELDRGAAGPRGARAAHRSRLLLEGCPRRARGA